MNIQPSRVGTYFKESKLTLLMSLPIMAGQVSQMLMGVADTIMVGRVGVISLAASSLANVIITICFVTALGFKTPISILASQAHGRDDHAEAGQILRHGLGIGLAVGLALVVAVTAISYLLGHFGQDAAVVSETGPYLRIVAWSLFPAIFEQGWKQFSEALHRPWLPMKIMVSAVLLNVFLNWVLIYGHLGAPALGLQGAGWATLIARILSVGTMIAVMLALPVYRRAWPTKWLARLEMRRVWEMVKMGAPISLFLLLEVSTFGMVGIMMGWLGAKSLAAHQIALNCAATTFMFSLGISFATRIRVGHALGRRDMAALPVIGFSAMGVSVIIMGCSALVFFFFNNTIAGWFVKDAEVVALAASLLIIAGIFQIADGLQVVCVGALNGLEDVRTPIITGFFSYWLITLPVAWELGFRRNLGGQGVWWSLAIGLSFASAIGITRFWYLSRKMARG